MALARGMNVCFKSLSLAITFHHNGSHHWGGLGNLFNKKFTSCNTS